MNRKRIIAIGKLVILFGTPLAVILGLFSCGVYHGVQQRAAITRFERDVLGLDVEVHGEPAGAEANGDVKPPSDAKAPADAKQPSDAKAPDDAKQPADAKQPSDAKAPDDTKQPPQPDPVPTPVVVPPTNSGGVPAPLPPPATRVDPLEEPLAARLRASKVVRVKVLVDASVLADHPDWIDYVQRTVSRASLIYQEQLGISLELESVGRWSVAPEGMGTPALLADLHEHSREGADVLLGLTSRPFDGGSPSADVPAPGAAHNGAYAVVHATPGHREAHVRTLLHEVSLLLGAAGVADSRDPAHLGGSWMSYAAVPETQAAWLDPPNRQRILERKDLPFAPEAAAAEDAEQP
jgi:hypothetical protein